MYPRGGTLFFVKRQSLARRLSASRPSPTHAFGILHALVSFFISIPTRRAVRARSPSYRHHRHPRCHQHPIDHPQLPLRRCHSSGEFPRHLCTVCSCLGSMTSAALSPCLSALPCALAPPTHKCVLPLPHTSASARTPPRYPCHRTCTGGSCHDAL